MRELAYLLLVFTIGFNLWLYYPETKILADPNDNIFQYSLVNRTNWVWKNYGCPISPSCLPNLLDHNVPNWAEGYPLPFYYSHLPQIAIVSTYHMFVKPFFSLLTSHFSLYQYYNWSKYLLLAFFPLPVYLALRLVGFSPVISSMGAFFSSHFSTDGLYGIDPSSFLWRGYGLTSQLYAIFFLPLGLAFTYRALIKISNIKNQIANIHIKYQKEYKAKPRVTILEGKFVTEDLRTFKNYDAYFAVAFLTLTTVGHLGIGIIGLISTLPFIFLDLNKRNVIKRVKKLFIVLCSVFFILSYWIIPILIANNYHIISFWDPIWKFNSYGWYEVVKQLLTGEIFDWQRLPIITYLTLIGFFILLLNKRLSPFSLIFAMWMLLYFGRTTWGGLIDLIPGMKDFHQHRFIVGVHIAALFLIPAGLDLILQLIRNVVRSVSLAASSKFKVQSSKLQIKIQNYFVKTPRGWQAKANAKAMTPPTVEEPENNLGGVTLFLSLFIMLILVYFTVKQSINYNFLNSKWIYEANDAYRNNEKSFKELVATLENLPSTRIYAGRPGNWGKEFRIGSTQMYMALGVTGLDISQFLPETWSMLSENEQNFDERISEDYDLLNIRYVVADKNHDFSSAVKLDKTFGPFQLFEAPTTGWFDVVTSPMLVKSDKTNFVNVVHLWHRSYPRRWKMHPLVSVEKKPRLPEGMQKIIEMKDEVSYIESSEVELLTRSDINRNVKNIFSDFPFVFPEATVSGKIIKESVNKQSYSATIDVPQNCKLCTIMFKMSYHPNWQAKLDGIPVTKFAVFPFYLTIQAPPGAHQVEFSYHPNKLKVFLLFVEIITVLIVVIFKISNLRGRFSNLKT